MPTTLNSGLQLPDKGSVDWYSSMQNNYNLLDNHLKNTNIHVTAEDKANWDSKQGSLSQAQLDAIAQVSTNTSDISALQTGKANTSHTHSSSDITDIGDYATKTYVDDSISGLVDSAPAALDTLKELSTALGDDANFATTVATALGNKANSADLATVATSGSYTDLSNKPSIPSKTSDLTNDSNFVDTSNSAVASGITASKVASYDGHIANTGTHVTTADKQKWNDNISQSYVLRYANTAVTPSSTIPYSVLNNTDNVKIGDSLVDTSGQFFLIASVDSANETVTVSAVLLTLALDANVMHLTGDETSAGKKTFSDMSSFQGSYLGSEGSTNARTCMYSFCNRDTKDYSGIYQRRVRQNREQGSMSGSDISQYAFDVLENQVRTNNVIYFVAKDFVDDIPGTVYLTSQCATRTLGSSNYAWSNVFTNQINSLNPGALSFPRTGTTANTDYTDVSGNITVIDPNTQQPYTNEQTFVAPATGWLVMWFPYNKVTSCMAWLDDNVRACLSGTFTAGYPGITLPVIAGRTIHLRLNATQINGARLYYCQGNV